MSRSKFLSMLGDRFLVVTKGEEDITLDVINLFTGQDGGYSFVPTFDDNRIQYAINGVVHFFKDMKAEQVFQYQYNVLIEGAAPGQGSMIRLAAIEGLPFLMFENSSIIQIPLGKQESSDLFKNASLLERVIASENINMIDRWDGLILGDYVPEAPSGPRREILENWYSRIGLDGNALLNDIRDGLSDGWLSKKIGSDYDRYSYEITAQNFSWHLPIKEGSA